MKKFKLSLKSKALLGIIFVLLPILITFFIVYNQNRTYLKQRILDTLTVIAEAYEGQVYQFLEKAKVRAQDFASDGFVRTQIQKAIHGNTSAMNKLNQHLVKNKLALDKTINTINVLSLDGLVIASTNSAEIGSDYSYESIFQKGKETVTMVEKCFGHSELTEIAISAPILNKDTGRLIGVIVNYIPIAELDNIITGKYSHDLGVVSWAKGKGDWKTLEVYLVNRDKRMITKSIFVKDAVGKQVVDTLPINEGLTSNKGINGFYRGYRGVEVAGASMYIQSMKWVLLVEIDKDEVLAPVKYILINTFITSAVVIAIIILLYIAFVKRIVKPLHIVSKAAKDIARDNIGIVVPVQTDDEIGMLCESFNSMSHDIEVRTTALKKVSKSLAEAQQIAHVGNLEWEVAKNKVYGSDEVYRIFGLTQQKCDDTYETFLNCIHPEDREFVNKSLNDALNNKKPNEIEFRILHKDGSVRIVQKKCVPRLNDDGKVIRMVCTVQDITERKQAEGALRESEEKLRAILDNTTAIVYMKDNSGRYTFINRQLEKQFNITRKKILGKTDAEIWLPEMAEIYQANDRKVMEAKAPLEFEEVAKQDDGLHTYISVKFPLFDSSGAIYAVCGISTDITERKQMEEEQAKMREQLYHVQKLESVGTLAGGIAHDFNNILTAIIGYGTLLQKDMKEGVPSRDYVQKILKSAERAADLTQGLLAFSRKQVSNPRPVYLNEIIQGVEGLLVRVMREDIKLTTSLTDKECVVMADVGQMEQVLMNLATNARDAMPDGGYLNLSTDAVKIDNAYIKAHGYGEIGRYALITVSDTGVGDKKTKER